MRPVSAARVVVGSGRVAVRCAEGGRAIRVTRLGRAQTASGQDTNKSWTHEAKRTEADDLCQRRAAVADCRGGAWSQGRFPGEGPMMGCSNNNAIGGWIL